MRRFYVAVALCVQSRALSVSRSGVRAGAKAVAARAPAKGDRKVAARRVQAAQMDRKHQADADFFWDLVERREAGGNIRGVSGRPFVPPTETELFGWVDKYFK